MLPFLNRNLFRLYLNLHLELLWLLYRILKYNRIALTCQKIDVWNRSFSNFQSRFPFLNRRVFVNNFKYWIHWIKMMDICEKRVFNKNQTIVQLNEEDWIHFDFSSKTIPIFYISFDFTINEWVRIELFEHIDLFEKFLYDENNSAESLVINVQNICRKNRMERFKNKSNLTKQ